MEHWKTLINKHKDTKGLFDSVSDSDQLIYWYFFSYDEQHIFHDIYFNIYFNTRILVASATH